MQDGLFARCWASSADSGTEAFFMAFKAWNAGDGRDAEFGVGVVF